LTECIGCSSAVVSARNTAHGSGLPPHSHRFGALVDIMCSEHRGMAVVNAYFRSAKAVTDVTYDQVTTDGHDSYPRAICAELGTDAGCAALDERLSEQPVQTRSSRHQKPLSADARVQMPHTRRQVLPSHDESACKPTKSPAESRTRHPECALGLGSLGQWYRREME
jgi:hypothetical protein